MSVFDYFKRITNPLPVAEYTQLDAQHLAAYGRKPSTAQSDADILDGILTKINNKIIEQANFQEFRYEYKIDPHHAKYVSDIFNHFTKLGYKCFMMNEDTMPGSGINSIMITWY